MPKNKSCRNYAGSIAERKTARQRKRLVIKPGQLCPYCGFAQLQQQPGGIVKCRVCGFGPNIRFT